jgi:thiol-disulfide isomerase/thioredoxin
MPGLVVSLVVLALAAAFGFGWRSRNGRMRVSAPVGEHDSVTRTPGPADCISEADLGTSLGSRATLLQFSTAFCAPCRATQQILADVAAMVDGVIHVEIDAGSQLDLVRRLDVRRTPTTFVLGPDGQVTHRASGQPSKADVIAALGPVA